MRRTNLASCLVLSAAMVLPLLGGACQSSGSRRHTHADHRTGGALNRLKGDWKVSGWIEDAEGVRHDVSGSARGSVEKTYFLRLDLSFRNPVTSENVEGTSVISQAGGNDIEMTNWFSSSPRMVRYDGSMNDDGTVFDLHQIDTESPRRLVIRWGGSSWTAEAWVAGRQTESYTFKR